MLAGIVVPLSVCVAAPVMRDAATSEQLTLAYRKAEQANPIKTLKPAEGPDAVTSTPKYDILADSDIVCFNGNVVLVPKRAILLVPKNVEGRLKYVEGAKLMNWSEFYAVNRGWITTVEVSRKQAEGNDPIPENTRDMMQKSGNLVIATYKGGPISVLAPQIAEESATQTDTP